MKKSFVIAAAVLGMGAIVVAPQIGEAQVKKTNGKYTLRMKWVKGAKFGYNITMVQAGTGAKPMQMGLDYTVKSVKNGAGTVDSKVSGAGSTPQTQTVTIDDRGRMTGAQAGGEFSNILEFPTGPIAVGGTWSTQAKLPGMTGGSMAGTAKNTLKGFKTEGGKQFAHISTVLDVAGGGVKGAGKSDTLVAMTDGQIQRSSMAIKFTITTKDSKGKPVNQSIDMSIKMTRK